MASTGFQCPFKEKTRSRRRCIRPKPVLSYLNHFFPKPRALWWTQCSQNHCNKIVFHSALPKTLLLHYPCSLRSVQYQSVVNVMGDVSKHLYPWTKDLQDWTTLGLSQTYGWLEKCSESESVDKDTTHASLQSRDMTNDGQCAPWLEALSVSLQDVPRATRNACSSEVFFLAIQFNNHLEIGNVAVVAQLIWSRPVIHAQNYASASLSSVHRESLSNKDIELVRNYRDGGWQFLGSSHNVLTGIDDMECWAIYSLWLEHVIMKRAVITLFVVDVRGKILPP